MNKLTGIHPAITIYQPWATWIVRGWKTIETRTHNRFACLNNKTVLIHAGMKTDAAAANNPYLTREQIMHNPEAVVNGYILGSVHVSDFRKLDLIDSKAALIDCGSVERYGLFLDQIVQYPQPIPVKGDMGIWYFDLDKMQKVNKNLSNR